MPSPPSSGRGSRRPPAPPTSADAESLRAFITRLFPAIGRRWRLYAPYFRELSVPAHAILLREGQQARRLLLVKHGALRTSLVDRGRDITTQFFFEDDMVASSTSFFRGGPSPISIEAIEPSKLVVVERRHFQTLFATVPALRMQMAEIAFRRFEHYSMLFLRQLRNNPAQRYAEVVAQEPWIIQRVPLRLVASYLGITPVSLSRIRAREARKGPSR